MRARNDRLRHTPAEATPPRQTAIGDRGSHTRGAAYADQFEAAEAQAWHLAGARRWEEEMKARIDFRHGVWGHVHDDSRSMVEAIRRFVRSMEPPAETASTAPRRVVIEYEEDDDGVRMTVNFFYPKGNDGK